MFELILEWNRTSVERVKKVLLNDAVWSPIWTRFTGSNTITLTNNEGKKSMCAKTADIPRKTSGTTTSIRENTTSPHFINLCRYNLPSRPSVCWKTIRSFWLIKAHSSSSPPRVNLLRTQNVGSPFWCEYCAAAISIVNYFLYNFGFFLVPTQNQRWQFQSANLL